MVLIVSFPLQCLKQNQRNVVHGCDWFRQYTFVSGDMVNKIENNMKVCKKSIFDACVTPLELYYLSARVPQLHFSCSRVNNFELIIFMKTFYRVNKKQHTNNFCPNRQYSDNPNTPAHHRFANLF